MQDFLNDQIKNISKASAYDALQPLVEELREENTKLKRLLHDLTPGGSEFYNDPEKCAKWIAESRREAHYTMAGIIKDEKGQNKELKEALKECREWYENTGAAILANQPGSPTPICFSKALSLLNR